MKKYISIALMVLALAGCKKAVVISDNPFTISIDNPSPDKAWIDIIPETNDFVFTFGHLTKKECDSLGSDENIIKYIDAFLRKAASEGSCPVSEFLYRGAWKEEILIDPGTEYYAYAIPYDDSSNPMGKLTKLYFKTVAGTPSNIKFDVSIDGSVIKIHPKDDCQDVYFWEYEDCSWVDSVYTKEKIVDYFKDISYFYKLYGFFPTMLSQGDSQEDMADWYSVLNPGDQVYLFASGYNGAINSTIYSYRVTYKGKDQKGEVVPLKEYPLETKSTLGKDYSYNRCWGSRKLLRLREQAPKPGSRRYPH